jgi:hypothetical protein
LLLRRSFVVLALAGLVAGCGGSSGGKAAPSPSPSPSPSPTAQSLADAQAEITTTWETFFKAGGTVDQHIALLQNGEAFRAELTASAKDPANKDLAAKVLKVGVNVDTALVTYNLLGKAGAVLLGGALGEAVRADGHWLVSKKTYCQLIGLQAPTVKHPGCA